MIVINFKTYPEATGDNALKLAKVCEDVAKTTGIKIVIGLQAADIFRIKSQVDITVFSQHADPVEPGRFTGWTTLLALKQAGATGIFLNHSEHPFSNIIDLEKAIKAAKQEGLETLVFSKDLKTSKTIDKFNPTYIALEEPSMVSGDIAMAQVDVFRDLIKQFSKSIKSFPLIGAGVKTKADVIESLRLGVKGIALASGFIKAGNPKQALLDLASGFK